LASSRARAEGGAGARRAGGRPYSNVCFLLELRLHELELLLVQLLGLRQINGLTLDGGLLPGRFLG
jgi:hypothetical protein